jgi:hypothetical protein
MKTKKPKARIVYVHPEMPEGRMHSTPWMILRRLHAMWDFLASTGVTIAHTELR